MRLLNTKTLELSRLFFSDEVPDYVILSHRWSDAEVTFADFSKTPISEAQSQARKKSGFFKVVGACEQGRKDGYEWIWIDSCCIDKSSSAELQEAINSMWRYYKESNICYVYLADVPNAEAGWGESFGNSDWFNRGWTLQELLAPLNVDFYARDWQSIGTKFERYLQIAELTSIDPDVLIYKRKIHGLSAAERMSWAAHRRVSKEEDQAYSLLGLFDINMPLLYGEGRLKAFSRLQEAIIRQSMSHCSSTDILISALHSLSLRTRQHASAREKSVSSVRLRLRALCLRNSDMPTLSSLGIHVHEHMSRS
jgi:hypothetical protein